MRIDLRRSGRMSLVAAGYSLIAFALVSSLATAQSSSIHQQILQTYNFRPHTLTSAEITQKSGLLDKFWGEAKSESNVYIPALRQELSNFQNPPFFLYDGSMLLLSLSDTSPDRKIALAAITHSDLSDVQPKDYFFQVHRMATLNEDTTAAAFRILEQAKFQVFIPQHSLMLGQNYLLIYMLLPTSQDYWLQPAIDRIEIERDEIAQKSLVLLLWYAQTDDGDKAIARFSADTSKPAGARNYAKQIMQRRGKLTAKQRAEALSSTEIALRQERRERMKAVSDEALIDLDDYTMMLAAKRK